MIESNFQIKKEEETSSYGKYIIEPLAQGYGRTLGNALRRVLLTSLKGAAITEVKISRVKHRFSTLPGLKEDVVEFILNLKKIRLVLEGKEKAKMKLSTRGPKRITAADIETPPEIKIANKDLYLGSLAGKKSKLDVEMVVRSGFGYSPSEERESGKLGVIPIDAIFSPVTRVNYKVEATRVGRMTNLDKLIIEVWTDGTINPRKSIKEAANILVSYFQQIYKPKKPSLKKEKDVTPSISDEISKISIEELELPTRVTNALLNGGIETVDDLLKIKKKDLGKIKNLGIKSITLIEGRLKERGVSS